jgi:hypothetical protein
METVSMETSRNGKLTCSSIKMCYIDSFAYTNSNGQTVLLDLAKRLFFKNIMYKNKFELEKSWISFFFSSDGLEVWAYVHKSYRSMITFRNKAEKEEFEKHENRNKADLVFFI